MLALQEVDRDQPRSELADLTAVAAQAMGAVSYRFAAAVAGTPGAAWIAATGSEQPGSAAYGIALLSRYPVRSWQVIRLPRIPFRFPMWPREPAKVLMVHEEPRVALTGVLDGPLGEMTVVNTHLSFVPGWNVVHLRLRRNLLPQPKPVILMGDLNLSDSRPARFTGYRPLAARSPSRPRIRSASSTTSCAAARSARCGRCTPRSYRCPTTDRWWLTWRPDW